MTLTVFLSVPTIATRSCAIRRQPMTGRSRRIVQREIANGAESQQASPSFLFLDPPDHTRLRRLVSKAFVPKVIKVLELNITDMVDALLDKAAANGEFDLIADLAYPLPVAVICRLLEAPPSKTNRISVARPPFWPGHLTRSTPSP